ncbi:hypothetical protein EVAR_42010_1 [Eumeta japonica]|uniref:Nucleic-acid-binding protein from transposon X-element n=1 Tax=Eumeta variegata TaxID=151549 RepID=A0A4C1WPS1_EUMVA|nr:hypothetical protein EVAR_42010_1 [Eumeta japonica]
MVAPSVVCASGPTTRHFVCGLPHRDPCALRPPPPLYSLLLIISKTVADFRNLQSLLVTQSYAFHTYSLKEEREIRVVLGGIPRSICSLSGIKAEQPRKRALPGQCHNCQSYGNSFRHCFNPARCVKCLGNHGTAQCIRNKDTDDPPACVLCKQKGHTANYLGMPACSKKSPPPEKAAPRRAPAQRPDHAASRLQGNKIRRPPRTI